jgi:hypothetical protein
VSYHDLTLAEGTIVVSAWTENVGKAPQRSTATTTNLNNSLISAHLQDHNRITKTPFQGWLLTDEDQRLTDQAFLPLA